MSRFERRLSTDGGGSSPRPGTATCKIRPRQQRPMLSGFIQVTEKNNISEKQVNNSKQENILIQEVSTKSYNNETEKAFENVMKVNEQLRKAIANTKNQNMRQLLIHELRLNTLEVNLDCLTDIKCQEVSEQQEEVEKNYNLESISEKVNTFDDSIKHIVEENSLLKKNIDMQTEKLKSLNKEYLDSISHFKDEINLVSEKNESLNSEIIELKNIDNTDKTNSLIEENESLKVKVDLLEEKLKMIVEKIVEKDNEKYIDLVDVLN